MTKSSKSTIVTTPKLGMHLGVSAAYVTRLVTDGVIQKRPDGRFDQDACRLAYLNHLRDPARRSARTEAASELHKAKARKLELENAALDGSLISLEDVCASQDIVLGGLKSALLGLSARVTRDMDLRRRIDDEIDRALNTAADEFEERADALGPAAT